MITNCNYDKIYSCAAKNNEVYGVLISHDVDENNKVSIHIDGCESGKKVQVLYITNEQFLEEEFSFTSSPSMDLNIKLPRHTIVFLKIK